ncbi:MAG: plasmid pRiA4b ORF-3 family protein [Planctomycetes bacterium]|nr:plasmid pRiA4b ORF-3 family protein [Planctomycetota bacterium]
MAKKKTAKKKAGKTPGRRSAMWVLVGSNPESIFELKVSLIGSRPLIWRRFEMASYYTLDDLHNVIQFVMGWYDCHMHQFIVDADRRYGPPPPADLVNDIWADEKLQNSQSIAISALEDELKKGIQYEYDFGDSWLHEINLVKSLPMGRTNHKPVCLAGKNACPPEDCGGLHGYYHMLDAIKDPKDGMYEEYTEWLGTEFDPAFFDIETVNRRLTKACR